MHDRNFYDHVYNVVRAIPPGKVTTYGAIARFLGSGRSARLVGWAMNKSHGILPYVPAHRVVNHQGLLTGKHHFGFPDTMRQLLQSEGVQIENDQVLNFKSRFWDPSIYLDPVRE